MVSSTMMCNSVWDTDYKQQNPNYAIWDISCMSWLSYSVPLYGEILMFIQCSHIPHNTTSDSCNESQLVYTQYVTCYILHVSEISRPYIWYRLYTHMVWHISRNYWIYDTYCMYYNYSVYGIYYIHDMYDLYDVCWLCILWYIWYIRDIRHILYVFYTL